MPAKQKQRSLRPAKKGSTSLTEQSAKKRQQSGRISAACEACKKRKTKCSGHPPPCHMCELFETPCVIDSTVDMRRRTALHRIIEESRAFQDTSNGLISILRGGDGAEIKSLIRQVQQTSDDVDLVKILHSRMQENHESDGLSMNDQIKEEEDEHLNSLIDGGEPSKRFSQVGSGLFRKRPFPTQDSDDSILSIDPVPSGSSRNQEGEFLGSMYLPMISKLRSVSDLEATRILHEFRTSPIGTEGGATLNVLNLHQSRPHLNVQTGQDSRQKSSSESRSDDRTTWHPSLRLAKLEHQTFTAKTSSQNQLSNQLSGNISQSFDHAISSMTSVNEKTRSSMDISNASEEVQTYPAIYDAMQVHKTSQVLEMFGDLRLLGGGSRVYRTSLEEFTARSSATIPVYLVQSRLVLEDSPLSRVFTGFRDAARQMIATGTPASDIVNGSDVVLDLFFRERRPTDGFTCSSWASELCRTFGEIDDFVRIACVFLLTKLMRWMIYPTPKTYSEMPECQRPTPTQCFVPHMPAIDLHPIPVMRDILCIKLQDWMSQMTQIGVSCNWPLTMDEVLETYTATGSIRVSKLFGDHISKGENWSFNSHALILYPELEGKVRIEDA